MILFRFVYWSGSEYAPNTGTAWAFATVNGFNGLDDKRNGNYAWALRDGDVGAIPEPNSVAILAFGVLGLALRRFKNS